MKLESNLRHHIAVLHTAPILDVVLLLLIFFLMSSRLVIQSGVTVDLPFSSWSLPPVEESHVITITAGPSPQVFLNADRVDFEELTSKFQSEKSGIRHVILKADRLAPYGLVMEISDLVLAQGYELSHAASAQRTSP